MGITGIFLIVNWWKSLQIKKRGNLSISTKWGRCPNEQQIPQNTPKVHEFNAFSAIFIILISFNTHFTNHKELTLNLNLHEKHNSSLDTFISIVQYSDTFCPTSKCLGQFSRHRVEVPIVHLQPLWQAKKKKKRRRKKVNSAWKLTKRVLISMNYHTTPKSWGGGGGEHLTCPPYWRPCTVVKAWVKRTC